MNEFICTYIGFFAGAIVGFVAALVCVGSILFIRDSSNDQAS